MLHLLSTAMPLPSRPRRARCDQHCRLLAGLPEPGIPSWLSLHKGVKCQGRLCQDDICQCILAAEYILDLKRLRR